jgi:hypothetical protein
MSIRLFSGVRLFFNDLKVVVIVIIVAVNFFNVVVLKISPQKETYRNLGWVKEILFVA